MQQFLLSCALRLPLGAVAALLLTGCALRVPTQQPVLAPEMPEALAEWSARSLPGKRATDYSFLSKGGQDCVLARAQQSVSLWRRKLNLQPAQLEQLQFDLWIGEHAAQASVTAPETDDAPARLLLGFDGDEASLSMRNRMQFELVQALTGEAPPYATLMYVWDAKAPVDTVVVSTRSDRIRKIVVGTGAPKGGDAGRWQRVRRDVRADFQRAFGEMPGTLSSMALMTDADNTRSRAEACYGEILLQDARQQDLEGSLRF